ncbi:amino acid ABC transporter substrate-binding protein, PAAT family [Colwellia chukchiensis]|uniref:Amino acid ABC transporter substrate-binding protein, PAAT family n=1 Tax=Colwellia chukchiensis TaxID=641665 RepID=A0A1H7SL52_9GAMM|nr:transporter substrate-binding domain-containing protein [Colwellia chukchiensis]SEL73342.1 amino acid ABC transporter substrate-binding protein, PAAT family [Colwellia chukchiensis]
MFNKLIFFIAFTLLSITGFAQQPFKVVVGLSKPPYVIEEARLGFEIELIRQVLINIGKAPEFIFTPYGRSEKMLKLSGIDAVITVNEQMFPNNKNLSAPYISYQNVAISRKKQAIRLNQMADFANYSIASFQLAHKVLGPEFARAVTQSPVYMQVAEQKKQVELLLLNRVDVLVMDINIFLHYLRELKAIKQQDSIRFHYIFPLSPYRVAFKNQQDVSTFDQAMASFKQSIAYQELVAKYQLKSPN